MVAIVLLSTAIHRCYLGSKVALSPAFWLNALNLAMVSYLSRK